MPKKVNQYFSFFFYILIVLSCSTKSVTNRFDKDILSNHSVNIIDFGAIPNDNIDDSYSIQKAINFAINTNKSSYVYCPPGIYILDKGLVIANKNNSGEYSFVTLTIGGTTATYAGDQNIGKTVVFKLKQPTFGLALQSARNCIIENIVFEGCSSFSTNPVEILNQKNINLESRFKVVTNSFSPSCAIVIDPFHKNVPSNDQYLGFNENYSNKSTGGSSMVLVRGCSFFQHYIAIANNPSANVLNGDNIRAENCHVSTCHTFWSAGQTQSRANSIENVYALFLNTFVNGNQIGSKNGTPPTISNVNLAGFCKQVFVIRTGFSGLNVYRSYFESIWTLGVCLGLNTSFDQCQFSFTLPNEDYFSPPFQLYTNNSTSFRDCNIQYFNNCTVPMPFLFRSESLLISGGSVEGGVVVADGYTNAGGDDMHKVVLENVKIKCLGKVAGKKSSERPAVNLKNEIIMGGEVIISADKEILINQGTTYFESFIEETFIEVNQMNKEGFFKSGKASQYKIGDNLFTNISISGSLSGFPNDINTQSPLGFVSKIEGNRIAISGIPNGFSNSKAKIYIIKYPTLTYKSGDFEKSSGINKYSKK